MRAHVELDIGRKTFASGLLPELIAVLRRCRPGDLIAIVGDAEGVGPELETWCRFTGNSLLETTVENGRPRWVFRYGAVALPAEDDRPVGSRLWLYTNFDCNLHCDYCCVRSSPTVPRRELGLARVQRIAREAAELGVKEIFVTGGEPFLLEDIGDILLSCAAAAPTTVLTNGMLFTGRRADSLGALPRDRIVLQISLDSATPELHDLHRGPGTWARTREGIQRARAQPIPQQPRTGRPSGVRPFFNRCFEECIPGETAPRFQLRPNALFVADHRDQIAWLAAAQNNDQLRQQTRRKSLSTNIQLDVSPHRNTLFYRSEST
jgi:hypothetical protein